MVDTIQELKEIKDELNALQQRVETLTISKPMTEAPNIAPRQAEPQESESSPGSAPEQPDTKTRRAASDRTRARNAENFGAEPWSLLRAGMAELAAVSDVQQIIRYFVGLATRTGLRAMLLKRWRTGMQVLECHGMEVPAEACKKRRDGKAPIPMQDEKLFQTLAEDRCVYAGPVPVKQFPLDLTLMLGRGSRERQIVVMPLPLRDHWTTFLYLDADHATEQALSVAETLSQYAMARLCLLVDGVSGNRERVDAILKEELERRQQSQAERVKATSLPESGPVAGAPRKPEQPAGNDPATPEAEDLPAPSDGTVPAEQSPDGSVVQVASGAPLSPEAILSHSGELPALPKAACHILAVIDDPHTTATRLEKAIAMDQALTAKVLRIANSPFYGAVREIKTVSEAIVRLGFITIRNWTLVAATKSIFLAPGASQLFRQIWRQSVLSAMASQLVANEVRYHEPDAVFLGGLMQNIGQLVLARTEPELFHEILEKSASTGKPYYVVEQEMLGFDHGALGALLIKEWNLSQQLEDSVRIHHRLTVDSPEKRLAAMIALGEEIAACSGGGEEPQSGGWENSAAATIVDISQEQYERLVEKAHKLSINPQFFE